VITFFITSADAATRSLALMTTSTDEPSPAIYAGLALSIGIIAMTLILFGNSNIVQSAAVVTGGPFAILGLVGLFGLIVAVRSDQQ
jgi:glycine betaine transporter